MRFAPRGVAGRGGREDGGRGDVPKAARQSGYRERRGRRRIARREGAASSTRRTQIAVVVFPGSNCEHDVAEALHARSARRAARSSGTDGRLRRADAVVARRAASRTATTSAPGAHRPRFSPVMGRGSAAFAASGGAGARDLQRFPSSHRGGSPARRASAQLRSSIHLRHRGLHRHLEVVGSHRRERRSAPTPATRPINHYEGGALQLRRSEVSVLSSSSGDEQHRAPLRRQPERLARRHRGGGKPVGQRRRADAAPRTRLELNLLGSTDGIVLLASFVEAPTRPIFDTRCRRVASCRLWSARAPLRAEPPRCTPARRRTSAGTPASRQVA